MHTNQSFSMFSWKPLLISAFFFLSFNSFFFFFPFFFRGFLLSVLTICCLTSQTNQFLAVYFTAQWAFSTALFGEQLKRTCTCTSQSPVMPNRRGPPLIGAAFNKLRRRKEELKHAFIISQGQYDTICTTNPRIVNVMIEIYVHKAHLISPVSFFEITEKKKIIAHMSLLLQALFNFIGRRNLEKKPAWDQQKSGIDTSLYKPQNLILTQREKNSVMLFFLFSKKSCFVDVKLLLLFLGKTDRPSLITDQQIVSTDESEWAMTPGIKKGKEIIE